MVLKSASFALIQANDIVLHQGSTQQSERRLDPESEYLKKLPSHFRSFDDVKDYPPNQVFIGNLRPKDLDNIQRPWYENKTPSSRTGKHGEIMPQDEFIGLIKIVDTFDLVLLEESFAKQIYETLSNHIIIKTWDIEKIIKNPTNINTINTQISDGAEPIYNNNTIVGCVKKAHAFDPALTSHVMFENLVSKASGAFALGLLIKNAKINPTDIDYIIECSEEACGDMNQRGGGNFAKAIGEVCGCLRATGSDTRGFCAAPAHAMVQAAALVKSGVYKNVVVLAGGSSAKLGMNAKDHVKKGLPVLEDVIGAFAALVGENDNKSPIIRTDIVGRHSIGSGASPQAVTQAIIADPLDRAGLKIGDIDAFSVEMQNPEVTEPAGAGDVPKANYKMIAALGVMKKEFERSELNAVVEKISMPGFAPTQGHIPSGVPFLGHAIDMIQEGLIERAMIVGKGSLFLGRLTNLFDGVSFLLEKNKPVKQESNSITKTRVGITLEGSELGKNEVLQGAKVQYADIEVIPIETHEKMEELFKNGEIDAAVTMHYNFPIGVSTIGRVTTPAKGRNMYIASTTGTSSTKRHEALIKNTISGIAAAKACGIENPTVGILNIEGARDLERALLKLKENGYNINLCESTRADGGSVMRGNDILQGTPDIMITDSLTGNVIMKMLSAFSSGGSYEAVGDGYGPGVGEGASRIVNIISRASGAPVIAGAIKYAAECAKGKIFDIYRNEFLLAKQAGLEKIIEEFSPKISNETKISPPPTKVVTKEINGIEILILEDAVQLLWKNNIYAQSGMGCTGPIILVAPEDEDTARETLQQGGYI